MTNEERLAHERLISAKLEELRLELSRHRAEFQAIYPGTFDGQPNVPRPELLETCRVLHDRHEIIRRLPPGGKFAEVGTMFGDFIVEVIKLSRPSEVHIFDFGMQNIRTRNREFLDQCGVPIMYHVGDSSEQMSKQDDGYFDTIYIDADHSYKGAWKDLQQAKNKIKASGRIICNDYTNYDALQLTPYGVYSAVNQFANEYNFSFEYIALASMGFHDVSLKKW